MSDNSNSFAISIPIGIFIFVLIMALFQYKDILSNTYFMLMLWIGYPLLLFIFTFVVNMSKEDSSIESSIIGSLPSVLFIFIAFIISSISVCRIPIASVFTPLFIKDTEKSKGCCNNKLSLSDVENKYSVIKGMSYGFYAMFATFFGIIIGNSYSTIRIDRNIMRSTI
jgi:hypothetical protein